MKIAYYASRKPRAQKALNELKGRYGEVPMDQAQTIIVLGGDGTMLEALHHHFDHPAPLLGLNCGTLGFLLNTFDVDKLEERIAGAEKFVIHPLSMKTTDKKGQEHHELAFNEVSLLRETHNSAKIQISVNDKIRIEELVCDGVMLATPVGSTAYNLSAGGPILPLDANLMALTPISPFRPRRWTGALLQDDVRVTFEVLRALERPVSATADSKEVRDVKTVEVIQSASVSKTLLFDPDNPLQERIFREQFGA
ncbi:MAG: NAD kinase [Alphaproteobacteria bacterium]|nr:NAD kinase [Alphaproteobacteria bacterium]